MHKQTPAQLSFSFSPSLSCLVPCLGNTRLSKRRKISASMLKFLSGLSMQEFAAPLYTLNGAPQKIITSVAITPTGVELNVSAVNKTASRLPEALWVSFKPDAPEVDGWKLRYYDTTDVKPTDVVEHGAVRRAKQGEIARAFCLPPENAAYSLQRLIRSHRPHTLPTPT